MKTCLQAVLAISFGASLPALAGAPISYTPTPVSGKYDAAVALNNAGVVAVNNRDTNVPYRIGYIATFPMLTSVGTLGGSDSFIRAINDKNEAVGESTTAEGTSHAFLFAGGRLHDLTAEHGIVAAAALNDRGDVAGSSSDGRAVVLRNGQIDVFGPPGSGAASINDAGDVAGDYVVDGSSYLAFRYGRGNLRTLERWVANTVPPRRSMTKGRWSEPVSRPMGGVTLSCTMTTPIAINDAGQILSNGCDSQGFCYVTSRFDPIPAVPEAPGAAMLLAGMATLGAAFASRQRRARIVTGDRGRLRQRARET